MKCWLTFCKGGHFLSPLLHCGSDGGLVARHPAVLSRRRHKVTLSVSFLRTRTLSPTRGTTLSWTLTPRRSGLTFQTPRSASGQNSFFCSHSALKVKPEIYLHRLTLLSSSSGSTGSMRPLTAWILTCTWTHTFWMWVKFAINWNICCVHVYLCGGPCD